jgi:GAF domain-containing protein
MTPILPDDDLGPSDVLPEPVLLVPVPGAHESLEDAAVLAAWFDALSNIVGIELQHDLLALWAYTDDGTARLVGPQALAADDVRVPLPAPRVASPLLRLQEELLLDAGYGSALCRPVRLGRRDVGLALIGAFAPDAYDTASVDRLEALARHIAPTIARIARPARPFDAAAEEARALERLGRATATARTPRAFAREVGHALGLLFPLERLEILITGASPDQGYRLDEHDEGALWSRPSLIVPREVLDPTAAIGDEPALTVTDASLDGRWRAWAADGVRSVLAARLVVAERVVGHLLAAAPEPGLYDEADARLLARLAPWIAARVEAFVHSHQGRVLRAQLGAAHAVPTQLRRMATILGTTAEPGPALRDYMAEATALLPFHRVRFAVRMDQDRMAMLVPGEPRALGELPTTAIGSGIVGRVLAGDAPHGLSGGGLEVELVFPLRVSGRVTGAMILTTGTPDAFTRTHLALAQQVADGVAPYVEHARLASMAERMLVARQAS